MIADSPFTELCRSLSSGASTAVEVAAEFARKADGSASHNTYLYRNDDELFEQARRLEASFPDAGSRPALYGVPISLKDCFDLAGTTTTCGSKFYAQHNLPATDDSGMAKRLKDSGALIPGKTHLHPLAYGITGQNPDYGDCLQPRDASLLTGGSSSGAAASVQEGSALAAIGTDTGGSVRVPAALCGLVGYRASHGLASVAGGWPEAWDGAAHLAASFDTVGFLLRDARDAAPIAHALFGITPQQPPIAPHIGYVGHSFLDDCDADVLSAYETWRELLLKSGAELTEILPAGWERSREIFAGIQAHEASTYHRGHYDEFEPAITQRLHWGASLTEADLDPLRQQLVEFRAAMDELWARFDLLVLPVAPVSRLVAAEDQSDARARILRYTTPFSLAGVPVVSLPGTLFGTGVQVAAAPGRDGALLAYVASLAQKP